MPACLRDVTSPSLRDWGSGGGGTGSSGSVGFLTIIKLLLGSWYSSGGMEVGVCNFSIPRP